MFDQLIKAATAAGSGDLLQGLQLMRGDLTEYSEQIQLEYWAFMGMGAEMFAPIDK
jgi:hypothetical protein